MRFMVCQHPPKRVDYQLWDWRGHDPGGFPRIFLSRVILVFFLSLSYVCCHCCNKFNVNCLFFCLIVFIPSLPCLNLSLSSFFSISLESVFSLLCSLFCYSWVSLVL
jgi:hypothetical protein